MHPVMWEAGGDAALSFYRLLLGAFGRVDVLAVDRDPRVGRFWESAGQRFLIEQDADLAVKACGSLGPVLPVDEWARDRLGLTSELSVSPYAAKIHNKRACYDSLSQSLGHSATLGLPRLCGDVITRKNRQAGNSCTLVHRATDDRDGFITTEYYGDADELVVDAALDSDGLRVFPRVTHRLVHGRDTFVTLLGKEHRLYDRILAATGEFASLLKVTGLFSLQLLLRPGGRLLFIEAALRLSGSSWLNLLGGNNPLYSREPSGFREREVMAQCGFGLL